MILDSEHIWGILEHLWSWMETVWMIQRNLNAGDSVLLAEGLKGKEQNSLSWKGNRP